MKIKPVSEWKVKGTLEFRWGLQGADIEYTTQGRTMYIERGVLDKIQNKQYTIKQVQGELEVIDSEGIKINKMTGKPEIKIETQLLNGGFVEPEELLNVIETLYKGTGLKEEYTRTVVGEIRERELFECRHGKWKGYRMGTELYITLGFIELPIVYEGELEIKYTKEEF